MSAFAKSGRSIVRLAAFLVITMLLSVQYSGRVVAQGQAAAVAEPANPDQCIADANHPCLPYSQGYLVTGNYAVAGVDFVPPGGGAGSVSGALTIHRCSDSDPVPGFNCVPPHADILSAYLYLEMISDNPQITSSDCSAGSSPNCNVMFRGSPVNNVVNVDAIKKSTTPVSGASCNASGNVPLNLSMFRVDVRKLLPFLYTPNAQDANKKSTGLRLVGDGDLLDNGYAPNMVTVYEGGTGNQTPQIAGASLVVIFRDPSQPLRKIDVYDGVYLQPSLLETTTFHFRGLYGTVADSAAQLTYIGSAGQKNTGDIISFNGTNVLNGIDTFPEGKSSSDRAWANPTFPVSSTSGADPHDGFGYTATTVLSHTGGGSYDCIVVGAAIHSTAVADIDHDGAPDGIEDSPEGGAPNLTYDANGALLPALNANHGSSQHKDIYIQMDAMRTTGTTTYGDATAPYSVTPPVTSVDVPAHNHLPTTAMLKLLIDTYTNAPITNTFPCADGVSTCGDGSQGIRPHFDVGSAYHSLGDGYTDTSIDSYLFSSGAEGGHLISETACGLHAAPCQFPFFPGTVGWMNGFLEFINHSVFDPVRNGIFHEVFYTHAEGTPRSLFPCRTTTTPKIAENYNGSTTLPEDK